MPVEGIFVKDGVIEGNWISWVGVVDKSSVGDWESSGFGVSVGVTVSVGVGVSVDVGVSVGGIKVSVSVGVSVGGAIVSVSGAWLIRADALRPRLKGLRKTRMRTRTSFVSLGLDT